MSNESELSTQAHAIARISAQDDTSLVDVTARLQKALEAVGQRRVADFFDRDATWVSRNSAGLISDAAKLLVALESKFVTAGEVAVEHKDFSSSLHLAESGIRSLREKYGIDE